MHTIDGGMHQLLRFGMLRARCCAFAVALLGGWEPVALTKFGAWALLTSVTFVLAERLRGLGERERLTRQPT
ncbi:hypothetical protein [Streptomyces sp. WMMC940]|uniref:hypothetical protein n=1 Tax=Streptomyces sp. WMMC940 TaxID=3015153 RepID=UPI0022B6D9B1|nr:hypothetical protein [Streptomyces sp. WMMC940]MCZ7456576.1 hypothetical protein [Streptomyces sp. WMMC940]